MPAPGTKMIEIDGRETYLPAEDVELEELIKAGLDAQRNYDDARVQLDMIKSALAEIAERRRHGRKTVHLVAPISGSAAVTFSTDTRVDEEIAFQLEQELNKETFRSIFSKRVQYSPARGLSTFMKRPQSKDVEALKARIGAALSFVPKKPAVKLFADESAMKAELAITDQ